MGRLKRGSDSIGLPWAQLASFSGVPWIELGEQALQGGAGMTPAQARTPDYGRQVVSDERANLKGYVK